MSTIRPITDEEFGRFKRLIYDAAGIDLSPEKQIMVSGRLIKRLRHYRLPTFGHYYRLITDHSHPGEFQVMVDLLTTNETYFFREEQHFDFLAKEVLSAWKGSVYRAWCAASSSGEEIYTLAMVLQENLGMRTWEILGSDISTRMLKAAENAVYPLSRADHMSAYYKNKYCLKGVRSQEGTLRIDPKLRKRVSFKQVNLKNPLPNVGNFDVIFLRNVLIYFDTPTKQKVVGQLIRTLNSGGYFFTSHSETLHGITDGLKLVKPSVYRKP